MEDAEIVGVVKQFKFRSQEASRNYCSKKSVELNIQEVMASLIISPCAGSVNVGTSSSTPRF